MGLEFRVDEFPVHTDLELASVRGNECHRFNDMLELLEQIIHQAYGPAGIMSDRAIDDFNFEHERPPYHKC